MIDPLYHGSARIQAGDHFLLKHAHEYHDKWARTKGLISAGAVKQLGNHGRISEVEWAKITLMNGDRADMPAIFIRHEDKPGGETRKFYLTTEELREMAGHYQVQPNVLEYAFFELTAGGKFAAADFILRPRAAELLDPAQRETIWNWAARKGQLKKTFWIPNYLPLADNVLVIPGFVDPVTISRKNSESEIGAMTYENTWGSPFAVFRCDGKIRRYELRGDIRDPEKPNLGRNMVKWKPFGG